MLYFIVYVRMVHEPFSSAELPFLIGICFERGMFKLISSSGDMY